MTADQAAGLLRTLIASIGGYLAGKGYLNGDQVQAIIGLVAPVIMAVWSFKSKAPK